MSPEALKEFNRILKAVILENGSLVDKNASIFGWIDYSYYGHFDRSHEPHHLRCPISSNEDPKEDVWQEFQGTFYEGDTSKHGVSISGVNCSCGKIKDRVFRWETDVASIAEAVFQKLFEEKNAHRS